MEYVEMLIFSQPVHTVAATSATHPAALTVVYWSDPAHTDKLRATTHVAALKAVNLKV